MSIISKVLIVLVALEFFYIMYLETFTTSSKATSRVFNMNQEVLGRPSVQNLFKNQGVYNGLIGVGLLYGLFFSSNSMELMQMILIYIILVASYGALTSDKKIILTQGGLAILALISTFL
jgi:putative membrane protein